MVGPKCMDSRQWKYQAPKSADTQLECSYFESVAPELCQCVWLDGRCVFVDAVHFFFAHALMFGSCLGSHCGEAHPRKSSQSLHCDAGLRLPDQDRPLPSHDHHERWRSQVLDTSTDMYRGTIAITHCCILVSVLNNMGTVYSNLY